MEIEVTIESTSKTTFNGLMSDGTTVTTSGDKDNGPYIEVTTEITNDTESGQYTVTTTVKALDKYTLLIMPTRRETLKVFVDVGNGNFEQYYFGTTYREALWDKDEPRADGTGTGAFVVGVPNTAKDGKVRTYATVPADHNMADQRLMYDISVPQGADQNTEEHRFTTSGRKSVDPDHTNTITGDPYRNVDITVGYTPFAENDKNKYELHIYRYSDKAFLTQLVPFDEDGTMQFLPEFNNDPAGINATTDPNPGQSEFFLMVDWDQTEVNLEPITAVKGATIDVTVDSPAVSVRIINDGSHGHKVTLNSTVTSVKILVTSEDGLHSREYSIVIMRRVNEYVAKLKDIQLISTTDNHYYDFSPVFHPDPDVGIYYFAMPADKASDLKINPVFYDADDHVTYQVWEQDGINAPNEVTLGPVIGLPGDPSYTLLDVKMKPGCTYHVAVTVSKNDTAYSDSTYHLYIYKNVNTKMDAILNNGAGITGMVVDKKGVTRTADKYYTDQNFYYTDDTNGISAVLSATPASTVLAGNADFYLLKTRTDGTLDPSTGEPVRIPITSLGNIPLDLNTDHNRYVIEIVDSTAGNGVGNKNYSSLTLYKQDDMAKLTNLRADEQIEPIFDPDWFEYFAYVPATKDTATLMVRTKNSAGQTAGANGKVVVENVRMRDVGGRRLVESDTSGQLVMDNIPLDQGVNRVTITVTAGFRGEEDKVIGGQTVKVPVVHHYRYAYEVELNLGDYKETENGKVIKDTTMDTGDIIEMDYTGDGQLAPSIMISAPLI